MDWNSKQQKVTVMLALVHKLRWHPPHISAGAHVIYCVSCLFSQWCSPQSVSIHPITSCWLPFHYCSALLFRLQASLVSVSSQVLTALLLSSKVFQEVIWSTWHNAPADLNSQNHSLLTLSEGTIIIRLNIEFIFIF